MANWLDTAFHAFDSTIIFFISNLQCGFMTFIFKALGILFDGGVLFLLLSVILMTFKKTRVLGLCIFGAICCGALITNLTLKPLVARIRPLEREEFRIIWQAIGSPMENEFSFPSGHTTSVMAGVTAIFLCTNKKFSWLGFLLVLIVGISRIYLIAHYPTDVIAGIIVGGVSGIIAYSIANWIDKLLKNKKESKLGKLWLEFDIKNFLRKREKVVNEENDSRI